MSIKLDRKNCPHCGAPVTMLICPYCDAPLSSATFRVPPPAAVAKAPHVGTATIAGKRYLVHGRLARGARCEVFLARRDSLLTEMVILKTGDVEPEWKAIAALRAALPETSFLLEMLPRPIAQEAGKALYRWRSGFSYTLEDVKQQYPRGVDGPTATWMWKRLLDLLGLLHAAGFSHGNVQRTNVLVHPRDHGAMLCGWSRCARGAGAADLADSAACIGSITSDRALQGLTRRCSRYRNANELKAELRRVAAETFGPPRFHRFEMR